MTSEDVLLTKLANFNLSPYEAKVYVALLKIGASNAYTVSKESGVPRARVYDVLEGLSRRGIVMVEDCGEGKLTYSPVPVKVFLERVKSAWSSDFDFIAENLQEIETAERPRVSYISVVNGKAAILAFCTTLLQGAKKKVFVSLNDYMYHALLDELQGVKNRGCILAGVTFTDEAPFPPLKRHHGGKTHLTRDKRNWFILSIDSQEMFYGHSAEYDGNAFYTNDLTHIYLLEDYIYHDIILNCLSEKKLSPDPVSPIMQEILPLFE